jgi:hypothetical protein
MSGPSPATRRRPGWTLRTAAVVTTAAAASVGVVAVQNVNPARPNTVGQNPDKPAVAAPPKLPFAKPAAAAQVLEKAFTVAQEPWVKPRPDQFAYIERTQTFNDGKFAAKAPNGRW